MTAKLKKGHPLIQLRHPWFNPTWRRVLTTAFLVLWGVFELSNGALFWAFIFLATGAVTGWVFFVDWTNVPEDET